jgi:hypothetical protein
MGRECLFEKRAADLGSGWGQVKENPRFTGGRTGFFEKIPATGILGDQLLAFSPVRFLLFK